MRRNRYPVGYPSRDVVDRQVAERILAERDALATQLQRAREAIGTLQRRLELRESENAELRYALETRQRPTELEAELARLRKTVDRLQVERDQASQAAEDAVRAYQDSQDQLEDFRAERDRAQASAAAFREKLEHAPEPAAEADRAQRLAADLANLRRRREQDIQTEVDRVRVRLLTELADVRDSLERALALTVDDENPWVHGLRGVVAQVDGHLRREGVELVGRAGELFDPHRHEAVAQGVHPEGRPNVVLDVLRPGLVIADEDLLVRPASVVVSR